MPASRHSSHLSGASLRLNMCANVPDVETPEVCRSLIKSVGYKIYVIGERQVHARSCLHRSHALIALSGVFGSRIPAVRALVPHRQQQSRDGRQVRSRCRPRVFSPIALPRVEYGFGPQYSSQVRQSVRRRRRIALLRTQGS